MIVVLRRSVMNPPGLAVRGFTWLALHWCGRGVKNIALRSRLVRRSQWSSSTKYRRDVTLTGTDVTSALTSGAKKRFVGGVSDARLLCPPHPEADDLDPVTDLDGCFDVGAALAPLSPRCDTPGRVLWLANVHVLVTYCPVLPGIRGRSETGRWFGSLLT